MNKTCLFFVAVISILIGISCLSEDSLAQTKRSIPKSVTTQKIISNQTPKDKTSTSAQPKTNQPVKTAQKTITRQVKNSSFKRIETVVPTSIVQGEPFLVTYKLYVTDEEQQNITDLAIIGPLNTEDIKLIRKMAGYSDQNLPVTEWQGGNLSNLDLRGATITKDKNPFLSIKSSETWTYTESNNAGYYHHSTYNMASMSDKEWKKFRSEIGSKQDGFYYDRTEDKQIIGHYYLVKDQISPRLFSDCTSLQHITLPHNVRSIDEYAFWGCVLLQEIRIPSSVTEIGSQAFTNCRSLDLVINRPKNVKYNAFENCSPLIRFQ